MEAAEHQRARKKAYHSETELDDILDKNLKESDEEHEEHEDDVHDGYHDDFEFQHDDVELSNGVRRKTMPLL
jgi:hypothetical protein